MQKQFLPTGRARYFPQSRYGKTDGVHTITSLASLASGQQRRVSVRPKVVDTHAIDIQVPSTHALPFEVADGVRCIQLNDLPKITVPPSGFAVVGSGKTGIDACLWLLVHEVDPDDIMWIMPRDSWLLDRARFQDGGPATALGFTVEQLEQSAVSTSLPDLYARLEAAGHFCGWILKWSPPSFVAQR